MTSEANGLFVTSKTPSGFVVKETQGGTSSATFDFLVHGVRTGFEDHQVFRPMSEYAPATASLPLST